MSLEKMLRSVFTDVWYMSEDKFVSFIQPALMSLDFFKNGQVVLDATLLESMEERGRLNSLERRTVIDDGVAVVPIHGVLAMGLDDWEKNFATDYIEIEETFHMLNNNSDVSAIVVDVDSPGGHCNGCHETAHIIANSEKPVFAFTRGLMASAAYFISAGSSAIYASPSSVVGSIGTYCAWLDYAGLFQKLGLKAEIIKSGEHKGTGIAGTSLTEEQREQMQSFVDHAGKDFRSFVQLHRPKLQEEHIQGQAYWGELAVDHGFVDSLATLAQTIEDARGYASTL